MITRAFKALDTNVSGAVPLDALKDRYNASRHPDVLTRKRTEEDALTEFLDTFEEHFYVRVRGSVNVQKAGQTEEVVTLEDFCDYYTYVSPTVDDDKYFELIISNTWNLSNVAYGKGWGAK
jgi:hypothetical protein